MPNVKYPIVISTSTTLQTIYDAYYFSTSVGSTIYTLTLPSNSCDGIFFLIFRLDSDNTITLRITGTNIYYLNHTTPDTTITQDINSVIMVLSHGESWYVTSRKLETFNGIPIFASALVANNGNPFYTFSGSGSNTLIASFSYPGSYLTVIRQGYFLVGNNSGTPIIQITLRDELLNIIYTSPSTTLNVDPMLITFTPTLVNPLPVIFSTLQIYLSISATTPTSSRVAFYSLRLA